MSHLDLNRVLSQRRDNADKAVQENENLQYIEKCNRELRSYANQVIDEYVHAIGLISTSGTSIDVLDKLGFRGTIKTKKVKAYPFSKLKFDDTFKYDLSPKIDKRFKRKINTVALCFEYGYIDSQGTIYLQCSVYSIKTGKNHNYYVEVDRQTGIDFLFSCLSLPIMLNENYSIEETTKRFNKAKNGINRILEEHLIQL